MRKNKSSKYQGVSWCGQDQRWRAIVYEDGKQRTLGNFKTEEDAHEAYEKVIAVIRPPIEIIDLEGEKWVEIDLNGRDFAISNRGRLKSHNYLGTGQERIMVTPLNIFGYKVISVKNKHYFIHGLVARYFIGESDLKVNHKDGDKLNNYVENLEYISNRANVCHGIITSGKKDHPIGAHLRKRDGAWVTEIKTDNGRKFLGAFATAQEASNRYINALKEYGYIDDYEYIVNLLSKVG